MDVEVLKRRPIRIYLREISLVLIRTTKNGVNRKVLDLLTKTAKPPYRDFIRDRICGTEASGIAA